MRDEWFIRGEVPMTKSEVRAVSLSKLELDSHSVLLDIGAGTGSVSVEAALVWGVKRVFAFEKKAEAARLFEENRKKAGTEKIVLKEGEALSLLRDPAVRRELEAGQEGRATHAFIGGSSGNMKEIVEELLSLNPCMRVVINVIALETLASVISMLDELSIDGEIVSVQVSRARKAGGYHLMQGQNPVYVISFGGEENEA